ncbi:MAG: cytochrome P450 [Actinomycetota bacterium]|nr:cytochrome P450 [Actinomycetota bacterium]
MPDSNQIIDNPTGCPITDHTELNVPMAPVGWHFDSFDAKREMAPVHTGEAGGHQYYLVTRMADIRKTYQTAEVFSNSAVSVGEPNPAYKWIPEMLDGHIHTAWRQLLTPLWSPAAVEKLKPKLRQRFNEVIDRVIARGECDIVADVALLFPNVIFMELMGLPIDDADQFQKWEVDILHGDSRSGDNQAVRMGAMGEVVGYFDKLITQRQAEPKDDMLSYVLAQRIDGEPIPREDVLAFCLLMFMAGLDTVAAQLTYNFHHLATHPEDRARLLAEPQLWPSAIEEFLRFYAFVTPSRKAMQDTEIAGCPVKAGHMVHLPLVSANRDPREFADADKVVIDREVNRHLAFGAGPHRCLGSHLAREELFAAMTLWHERIPNYRVAPGVQVMEHGGQIGIESLPIVWDV